MDLLQELRWLPGGNWSVPLEWRWLGLAFQAMILALLGQLQILLAFFFVRGDGLKDVTKGIGHDTT